ncbi:MAG: Signal recognition particle 54 kDa protein [Pseudomonadota bacterium]
MELKRIIAKDLRSATEMAVAQYGQDTLVISHEMVGGKTEIIIAVDVQADAETLLDGRPSTASSAITPCAADPQAFESALQSEMGGTPESDRDALRAREIVDLVRQEMASLRKELQISTRAQPVMAPMNLNPVARQIDRALEADHAPIGLRMLLSEELSQASDLAAGLSQLQSILLSTVGDRAALRGPLTGFHALMGPSGAGKTTMLAKLARQSAEAFGADSVTVISWSETRPGAWQQLQLSCARIGVDCMRCQDPAFLPTLLEEVGPRSAVFIDTPGTELTRHRQLLQQLAPEAALHIVLPADVATHQAERLLRGFPWQSLMLTKADEAHHVWGVIQALSHVPTILWHQASNGEATQNIQEMSVQNLVGFALERLQSQSLVVSLPTPHLGEDRMGAGLDETTSSAWALAQRAGHARDSRYS